ncbi:hypothetical protein BXZ70DRAFT_635265 [Cristinia sonorae]|uniref:Uncharacterized protein n=1 Tax=Cristinia sonorae TaxID=1940300 RepID=A0A8K0UGM5_9AGAR|nr:hypothetical protein BXZ70DRAFT_635265 [Cristinia sonorae]
MDILQAVDLKTFLYPAENTWILRHTFLTFMHFQSLSLSNEHPSQRIAFPDPAGLHSSSGNTLPTSSIALSRLRASSLVYLAQLSYADGWTVSDCITLFSQIEEYHVHGSGNNDASYFSVIATAMLLGFKINESSSLNSSTSEGWAEATEYILCEIQRQLQWRPSDDNRRPQIAQVFGYDENLVGDDALTMFSRIIHIVQFASQSLLVSRSVPPSGLTLFVATICRSSGVDRRTVYQAVTDSIQLLTPTAEDLITGNDGGFHAALNAVAKLKPISEDHPSHSSAFHAFIQMQHTALTLILSLAQSDTLRSTTRVPTFSPGSCPWDLSQPQSVVFPGTQLDELITERDTLFVDVLRKTPAGSKDISVRRACFDDPRNFGYVLQWIHIAHRWLVPPQDGLTHAMADSIGSDFLLDCAQFRQPDASVWGDNLVHVQQVLVAVLCRPWYLRLDIAGNGDEADFGDLIHSSLFVLPKMRAADAAAVEWYVRETVDSFQTCLARIRRKYGVVDPSLKAVLSAYKRKLLEIERWKRAEPSGDASSTSTSSGSTSQASEETSMSRQEAETESVVERERDEDAGDGGSQQLLQQRANVTRRGKESGGEGGSAVLGEDVFSDSEETETEATEDSSDGSVHGEGSSGGV